jgi:hypothetical protein
MVRWHRREDALPCECLTTVRLLCARPSRWTLTKDADTKRACTAHAVLLEREGWIRQWPVELGSF